MNKNQWLADKTQTKFVPLQQKLAIFSPYTEIIRGEYTNLEKA